MKAFSPITVADLLALPELRGQFAIVPSGAIRHKTTLDRNEVAACPAISAALVMADHGAEMERRAEDLTNWGACDFLRSLGIARDDAEAFICAADSPRLSALDPDPIMRLASEYRGAMIETLCGPDPDAGDAAPEAQS